MRVNDFSSHFPENDADGGEEEDEIAALDDGEGRGEPQGHTKGSQGHWEELEEGGQEGSSLSGTLGLYSPQTTGDVV